MAVVARRRFETDHALNEAVDTAVGSGELTAMQARRIKRAVRLRPDLRQRVLDEVDDKLHEAGMVGDDCCFAAPDWNAILEFIKGLLPVIMQIIGLFK